MDLKLSNLANSKKDQLVLRGGLRVYIFDAFVEMKPKFQVAPR